MDFLYALLGILNGMSPYILLGFFIAGLLHVFVRPDLMSRHLSGNGFGAVTKAALLGIPLPLCSCGVLPTAVSLRRNGASAAASTSFLIATPQTGVDSIAATYSLLGPFMAVVRPVAALVGSVFGGICVGKLAPDAQLDIDGSVPSHDCDCEDGCQHQHSSFVRKLIASLQYGFVDMIQHVGKWLVIGLFVGALITVFVPDDLLVGLSQYPLLAMLAMVAIAVPMYVCATGSIPIAMSLMLKGLSPGVAFVLLMAGPAANFASVMVLRKAMGQRATAIYVASVVVTAISFGLLIDLLVDRQLITMNVADVCCHSHHGLNIFDTICSVILVTLLVNAYLQRRISKSKVKIEENAAKTFKITGMMCPHCEASVREGIASIAGVNDVIVDLSTASARVSGSAPSTAIIEMVHSLGYEAEEISHRE